MSTRKKIMITSVIVTIITALIITLIVNGYTIFNPDSPGDDGNSNTGNLVEEGFGPANLNFAAKLTSAVYQEDENLLLSPVSILLALAMSENGAATTTLTQMETVLLESDVATLNDNLAVYLQSLDDDKITQIANSIWIRDDKDRIVVKDEFVQAVTDYYSSDVFSEAFDTSTLDAINEWITTNTDGMVENALDQIPDEAVMYLINTVLFEARWDHEYSSDMVRDGKFSNYDGSTSQVEYLYGEETSYLEDDQVTGFVKDYQDGRYSFVALLPKSNLDHYLANLTGTQLADLLANEEAVLIETAIPKFAYSSKIELAPILSALGMPEAFSQNADFSKMATTSSQILYISQVLHNTSITLNEIGTKAGAVTIVEMRDEALPQYAHRVILDRPFAYLIYDNEMGLPLFIGAINNL